MTQGTHEKRRALAHPNFGPYGRRTRAAGVPRVGSQMSLNLGHNKKYIESHLEESENGIESCTGFRSFGEPENGTLLAAFPASCCVGNLGLGAGPLKCP